MATVKSFESETPNRAARSSGAPTRARLRHLRIPGLLAVLLTVLAACRAGAAPLSDPQIDAFNTRVGTQTFAGLYQFTRSNLLVETAQAILGFGSDTIKMYLGSNYPRQYHTNLPPTVTDLLTLARNEPNCRAVLDMPFRRIIAWAYPFSNSDAPFQGASYTAAEQANDYREMYDLTRYLLTNYNNSGKTFYLGHWEGDGYLNVNNWTTNPSPIVVSNMAAWENTRQKGVDDARVATVCTNVNVFYYLEVNRVRDAMLNGPTNNLRVVNGVLPFVTNLDFVSYSSYDAMNLPASDLYATLDYIEGSIPPVPPGKTGLLPAERLWIGEYGWGGYSTASQEPLNRAYIQRLLNYGRQALPFILFWEIYNNETNRLFCLVDSNNVKTASWYLHQRFINSARLLTARFKETNGRLPTDAEFVSLVSPLLNYPLPAPTPLVVSNLNAVAATNFSERVSGRLTQGVYGDDEAGVWVFWGRQDGGTTRGAWEQGRQVGINTNFNPAVFSALLTNLAGNATYYYRFYATNRSGERWAPVSGSFDTAALDPADFGSRLKISFAGYTRSETLSNFPVLVSLGTNLAGFSYRQFASATGGDLRFTDAGGTRLLPFEIDRWDTNGVSTAWVRLTRLAGPGDFIWAYWGNPAATNPPASSDDGSVWSPDFEVVYHLEETGFPYADSTFKHPALTGSRPTPAAGRIGRGCLFNGTGNFLDAGFVGLGDQFTLSAWVNINPGAGDIQTLWANQKGGFGSAGFAFFVDRFQTTNRDLRLASGNGAIGQEAATTNGAVSFGQWHLLAAAVNRTNSAFNGTVSLYVDGSCIATGDVVSNYITQADLNLGRFTNNDFYFHGLMDEARIENLARSSNWVWAAWMTTASNCVFASCSTVTQQVPSLSFIGGAGGLSLCWPGSAVGFSLYSATNLAPPVTWAPTTDQALFAGNQWQLPLSPTSSTERFYRLRF